MEPGNARPPSVHSGFSGLGTSADGRAEAAALNQQIDVFSEAADGKNTTNLNTAGNVPFIHAAQEANPNMDQVVPPAGCRSLQSKNIDRALMCPGLAPSLFPGLRGLAPQVHSPADESNAAHNSRYVGMFTCVSTSKSALVQSHPDVVHNAGFSLRMCPDGIIRHVAADAA